MKKNTIEITQKELNEFLISDTRWIIKNKNYLTNRWVKRVKKYWERLDKDTQKIIRNETRGRVKQLSHSHPSPETLHYYNAYVDLLNWVPEGKEMETNIQQTVNVNNGWLKGRPEHDGTYLVVLDDYTVTTLDYECWEGEWDGISNDGVLYWQPFPEPPEELKNDRRKQRLD